MRVYFEKTFAVWLLAATAFAGVMVIILADAILDHPSAFAYVVAWGGYTMGAVLILFGIVTAIKIWRAAKGA